jgi:hypothetical protein
LIKSLDDKEPVVGIVAAEALVASGQEEKGAAALISGLDRTQSSSEFLFLTNAITSLGLTNKIPAGWAARVIADPQAAPFKKQFARELRNPGASKKAKGGKPKKTAE